MSQASTTPLLRLEGASVTYTSRQRSNTALAPLDLAITAGRSLGIVGESGAGKTTLLSLLLGLRRPSTGAVYLGEENIWGSRSAMAGLRRTVQVVFQDPMTSLDPRMKIEAIVGEGLHGMGRAERRERVRSVLERVGLEADALGRYPGSFSGGQRQRIAIARALAPRPKVLVADEPVSALDVLVRRQVVELLGTLVEEEGLTLVVVSHDIGLVAQLCPQVLILERGQVVEAGATREVLRAPQQEYTRQLLAAIPRLED